jgi:hypothetical protein
MEKNSMFNINRPVSLQSDGIEERRYLYFGYKWVLLSLLITMLILSGCMNKIPIGNNGTPITSISATNESEVEIPFDVLKSDVPNETGILYEDTVPNIFAITQKSDAKNLLRYFSQSYQDQLNSMDYSRYLVLAMFLGEKDSGAYVIKVQRIIRKGDTVSVLADFIVPQPDTQRPAVITSPFELVRIRKIGSFGKAVEFQLIGTTLVSKKYFIP